MWFLQIAQLSTTISTHQLTRQYWSPSPSVHKGREGSSWSSRVLDLPSS